MSKNKICFSEIRQKACENWLSGSGRELIMDNSYPPNYLGDSFFDSYECQWQTSAQDLGYKPHISIFCSFGEFTTNITDLLTDKRFDDFQFGVNDDQDVALFRFYARILLIISEILTDFQDVYILASEKMNPNQYKDLNKDDRSKYIKKARSYYSIREDPNEVDNLLNYINTVCKHKVSNIHLCNNHLGYHFEDSEHLLRKPGKAITTKNIRQFMKYSVKEKRGVKKFVSGHKPEKISMPKLEYIVNIVRECYILIDELFFTKDNMIQGGEKKPTEEYKFLCELYKEDK